MFVLAVAASNLARDMILLRTEFWIITVNLDIGDIEILFAYGREGRYLPIMRMLEDKISDEVPGY